MAVGMVVVVEEEEGSALSLRNRHEVRTCSGSQSPSHFGRSQISARPKPILYQRQYPMLYLSEYPKAHSSVSTARMYRQHERGS